MYKSSELGDLKNNLILKTAGKIKIQWGHRKFIDLIGENGKINVPVPDVITPVDSIDNITSTGFYYYDGRIIAVVNGEKINCCGSCEGGDYYTKEEIDEMMGTRLIAYYVPPDEMLVIEKEIIKNEYKGIVPKYSSPDELLILE